MSPILDFRPPNVVSRLSPNSGACPISLRSFLRALPTKSAGVIPTIRAPLISVARAALLAAKEAKSAIGLMLSADQPPEPWFNAVCEAADEFAPYLPITLCAEVRVGPGAAELERASTRAFKVIDAGITHLAVDLSALDFGEQASAMGAVAGVAFERELGVEWIIHRVGPPPNVNQLASLHEVLRALKSDGHAPDLVSAYQPGSNDEKMARSQIDWWIAIETRLGVPLMRRGPTSAHLLKHLAASGLRMFDDGGATLAAAGRGLPEAIKGSPLESDAVPGQHPLEAIAVSRAREIAALGADALDRMEALAYMQTLVLLESTGTGGSAPAVTASLESRSGM